MLPQWLLQWKKKRASERWFKEMDFKPTTDRQKQLLNEMLKMALVEIRILCWNGQSEQAADLTDAFHNLPTVMYSDFSFPWFRRELEFYQNKYERGTMYTDMLDKVIREEELFSRAPAPNSESDE